MHCHKIEKLIQTSFFLHVTRARNIKGVRLTGNLYTDIGAANVQGGAARGRRLAVSSRNTLSRRQESIEAVMDGGSVESSSP